MPTPATRTPVRVARGTYANLNASIADLLEGEICYATDQNTAYVVEGGALVSTGQDLSAYLTSATAASTYAPLASPALTGTPTAPTAAQGDISTQVATTAFVNNEISHDLSAAIGVSVQAYDIDTAKTDTAQSFTAAQRGAYVSLTDAATVAIDMNLGNQFQVTLGGNRTLGAPTNVVAGQSGVIRVLQDGSGSRTLAYNAVFKFPGGVPPVLTTAANSVDLLAYHVESATRIAVRFIGDVK